MDDLIVAFKQDMMSQFEMTDLSLMNYYLAWKSSKQEKDLYMSEEVCIKHLKKI